VEYTAHQEGLELVSKLQKEDWIALAFRKPISK
jgi:hypothetical protein